MAERGKFISFEGGEGAGKSTQTALLRNALRTRGLTARLTREPGGSPGAEEIRKLLVNGDPERWTPLAETLLFLAARADHVARIVEPALAAGEWVISDRFADSTFVYQGLARGLGVEKVQRLQRMALGEFAPDLTFVLDLDPGEGLKRARGRGGAENRFEHFNAGFHARLRAGFLDIAAASPQRCVVIDAARGQSDIARDIWAAVRERFQP
jgi:dTMP kinase